MLFTNLTNDFIQRIIIEIKKDNNQTYIHNQIIQPILDSISRKIIPYFTIFFIMYILLLVLIIIIFILIFYKN